MLMREEIAPSFYIEDHAVLVALIVKSAGESGRKAVMKGIAAYGRERGLRGAARCLADGEPLSLKNYMLYGEWADPRGWSASEVVALSPNYRTNMTRCGWCDTWKKYGLLEYGKAYCDCVDENLVYGFNPTLAFRMGEVMAHGGVACEFDWLGFVPADAAEAEAMAARRAELIPRVTRDFLYHCGHVFSTFGREIYLEFGLERGREILGRAMAEYERLFGREKREAVEAEARQNFLV